MMFESESGWLEWEADGDCIRVGLHTVEGWYAVAGRDRPMSMEHGTGPISPAWIDLVGGVAAHNIAEAYAP